MSAQRKDAGLQHHPKAGEVVMCDFGKQVVPPEIPKRRPVVVITPRLPHRDSLAMVVPLSQTAPDHPQPFHVKLTQNPNPLKDNDDPVWVKCDLITNVSLRRLDRFQIDYRKFTTGRVTKEELIQIRQAILAAIGMPRLTAYYGERTY
jgi:uncharacterized protein YifN (PemK superfamily)